MNGKGFFCPVNMPYLLKSQFFNGEQCRVNLHTHLTPENMVHVDLQNK